LCRQENYEEAFAYYYQAVKLNPNLLLAQFGLAQMYIHRGTTLNILCRRRVAPHSIDDDTIKSGSLLALGQPTEAAQCLEKVLEKYPENYETLKV